MTTSLKTCFKCHQSKHIDEFYKHSEMADGHLNKCKECTKKDVSERYNNHFDRVAEYERKRFKTAHRKAKVLKYQRDRRARNPEKYKARQAVGHALRNGTLKKLPCKCGSMNVQAHHDDYSKPLEVKWFCFTCHRKEHGQLKHSINFYTL